MGFSKRIVKGIRTGNEQYDGASQSYGFDNFSGSFWGYNYMTSKDSDFRIQLEPEIDSNLFQSYYKIDFVFDHAQIDARTQSYDFLEIDDGTKSLQLRFGVTNSQNIPFKTYLEYNKPNYYGIGYGNDFQVFLSYITSDLNNNFQNYTFWYDPDYGSGDTIQVIAKRRGSSEILSITHSQNVQLSNIQNPDEIFFDSKVYASFSSYDCLMDVYWRPAKISDYGSSTNSASINYLGEKEWPLQWVTTLKKAYNDNHIYTFNLSNLIRDITPNYLLSDFSDSKFGQFEPHSQIHLKVSNKGGDFIWPEIDSNSGNVVYWKVRVHDSKWNTNSEELLLDYLDTNNSRRMANFLEDDHFSSKMNIFVDLTKWDYSNPITNNVMFEFSSAGISENLQFVISYETTGESVNFQQGLEGILNDIQNIYLENMKIKLQTYYGGVYFVAKQHIINNKFGWVECDWFHALRDLTEFYYITNPNGTVPLIGYIEFQGSWGKWGDTFIAHDSPFPQLQQQIVTDRRNNKVMGILNNYRKSLSNYFWNQFEAVWPWETDGDILDWQMNTIEEVDVYCNPDRNYCSGAYISIFTYYSPLFSNGGNPEGDAVKKDSYLSIGRMRLDYESGSVQWKEPNDREGSNYMEDILQIESIVLDTDTGGESPKRITQGTLHYNFGNLILNNSTNQNFTHYPSNVPIRTRAITTHFDVAIYDIIVGGPADGLTRLPFSKPFRFNIIPVQKDQIVSEFVYKTHLGGFSSLNILGPVKEVIRNETQLETIGRNFVSSTSYWRGDTLIEESRILQNVILDDTSVLKNNTESIYTITFRTSDEREYNRLRDMVESDKIYFRVYDNRFPDQYVYKEVICQFNYNSGSDLELIIDFIFADSNMLKMNEYNRV